MSEGHLSVWAPSHASDAGRSAVDRPRVLDAQLVDAFENDDTDDCAVAEASICHPRGVSDASESAHVRDERFGSNEEEDNAGTLALARRLLDEAVKQHYARMPALAQRTHRLAEAYRREDLASKVDRLARTESGNMPYECAVAIIQNDYVDFAKVYAHTIGRTAVELVTSSRDDLFVSEPASSASIPDAHAWTVVFDKVASLTLSVYPHRQDELSDYRRWFSHQVQHGPDLFSLYRSYDENYRKHFGGDGYGWTLTDAKGDTAALLRHFLPTYLSGGGSYSRKRSRTPSRESGRDRRRRYEVEYSSDICARFNEGKDHNEAQCAKACPPRRHVCAVCGSDTHGRSAPSCPRFGG